MKALSKNEPNTGTDLHLIQNHHSGTLSSFDRLRRRMRGEPVDRAPNFDIIMAYGVRHIGAQLRDYYLDYRVLVEMNLAMLADFQLDIVQTLTDPYREAVDWGLEVEFPEDNIPLRRKPLILDPADINKLKPPTPENSRRMSDRLAAVEALKQQVGDSVPVMGWVEGALAEANDLRGDTAMLTDLYDRPEWLTSLLEMLTEVEIEFARAQVKAGADIIGLGDAIASTISPKMYRQFALPYEQRIFTAVREMGAIPRLHICGDTNKIIADMAKSGTQIIDVDWMVDFASTAKIYAGQGISICGNFDPVQIMLRGTTNDVYRATSYCLETGGATSISAAGCEIPVDTLAENIHAQNRALADFSRNAGSHEP